MGIQNRFEILASEALADEKSLPQQMQVALASDLSNEGHASRGQRDDLEHDLEAARHALKLLPPPVLLRS